MVKSYIYSFSFFLSRSSLMDNKKEFFIWIFAHILTHAMYWRSKRWNYWPLIETWIILISRLRGSTCSEFYRTCLLSTFLENSLWHTINWIKPLLHETMQRKRKREENYFYIRPFNLEETVDWIAVWKHHRLIYLFISLKQINFLFTEAKEHLSIVDSTNRKQIGNAFKEIKVMHQYQHLLVRLKYFLAWFVQQ